MEEIQLSQYGKNRGKYVALVDDEDFERANQFRWCADEGRSGAIYAKRNIKDGNTYTGQKLHVFIMGEKDGFEIDHIKGNELNCQKSNLRYATHEQNCMNRKSNINTTSKYRGVSWYKTTRRWISKIYSKGKFYSIGYFHDEIEAARAYDLKAVELFGVFARLNFPG